MNHIILPSIVLLLSMATCAAIPPPPESRTATVADSCDAIAVGWVVGDKPTPDVIEQARLESGSVVVQVMAPGQSVALGDHPDRLNITTDESGTIAGLSCG